MPALRIALGVLFVLAAAVAVVPALVLFDLVSGGTGWGLCSGGLSACDIGYFAGMELLVILFLALFAVLALAAVCMRALRHLEAQDRGRAGNGTR